MNKITDVLNEVDKKRQQVVREMSSATMQDLSAIPDRLRPVVEAIDAALAEIDLRIKSLSAAYSRNLGEITKLERRIKELEGRILSDGENISWMLRNFRLYEQYYTGDINDYLEWHSEFMDFATWLAGKDIEKWAADRQRAAQPETLEFHHCCSKMPPLQTIKRQENPLNDEWMWTIGGTFAQVRTIIDFCPYCGEELEP
jgi:hypothetical protein